MSTSVTVGYWDCRGLAHPIVLLLEFLKKPYELKVPPQYLIGPPPDFAKTKWFEAKEDILKGFDFPNLPYYHDSELNLKLTQTNAIIMHIARTNDLCPKSQSVESIVFFLTIKRINTFFFNLVLFCTNNLR